VTDDSDLPPLRTCPRCGREGRTRYERCPHCQSSYYARSRAQQRRRILTGAGVLAVVAAGLGVAVLYLSDATGPGPRVAVAELRPRLRHEISLATRADGARTPAAQALLELAAA